MTTRLAIIRPAVLFASRADKGCTVSVIRLIMTECVTECQFVGLAQGRCARHDHASAAEVSTPDDSSLVEYPREVVERERPRSCGFCAGFSDNPCRALVGHVLHLADMTQRRRWSRQRGNAMTQSKFAVEIVTPT